MGSSEPDRIRVVPPGVETVSTTLRECQERHVRTSHLLASLEYALADEALLVGRVMLDMGLRLDPATFVVSRLLEVCCEELAEPERALAELTAQGVVERSLAAVHARLAELRR